MSKDRKDPEGFHTTITPLGNGKYGARVWKEDKIIFENNKCKSRQDAAAVLKELLRWVDKLGFFSPMASASRDRRYKKEVRQKQLEDFNDEE